MPIYTCIHVFTQFAECTSKTANKMGLQKKIEGTAKRRFHVKLEPNLYSESIPSSSQAMFGQE
jgi:hypothetical protein